jgi:hypothetical protein
MALTLIIATIVSLVLIFLVYWFTGLKKIQECYKMWFTRKYWTNYNIIEAISWLTKACIIVPGLIFGIHIWQFYFLALFTSITLIWASNKKLLPTLVGFNSLWVWISCVVLVKQLIN